MAATTENSEEINMDPAAIKASISATVRDSMEAISEGMSAAAHSVSQAAANVTAQAHEGLAEPVPSETLSGPRAGWILRSLGKLWLRVAGWKTIGSMPAAPRAIFIASPHTSNWDLPFALAVAWAMDIRISWAGKSNLFRFPFGGFMRWLGGVPVERSKRDNQVEKMAEAVRQADKIYLVIAPSGTRSKRDHWKSGFYHIAKAANAPILLAFLDYARKQGGLGPLITVTTDMTADMDKIRAFYAGIRGKRPERETPPRLKEEG